MVFDGYDCEHLPIHKQEKIGPSSYKRLFYENFRISQFIDILNELPIPAGLKKCYRESQYMTVRKMANPVFAFRNRLKNARYAKKIKTFRSNTLNISLYKLDFILY